ncbi:MAG: prepilin-type N-terminal cleavage/methylation domain-containing protein [Betaproteobacteria bacterium]
MNRNRPVFLFTNALRHTSRASRAFTLIELLVVMAIIATLLTLAVPRYFHSTDKAREAVLKQNLSQMREAIDKFYVDRGRYPDTLDDLVGKKYLRSVPLDPVTESTQTWLVVSPDEAGKGSVFDVRSGATGLGLDGTGYSTW